MLKENVVRINQQTCPQLRNLIVKVAVLCVRRRKIYDIEIKRVQRHIEVSLQL